MANSNRPTVKTRNAEVQAGIDKHITGKVTIGGVAYTVPELKAVFQAQSAAFDQADALHTQWRDQVVAVKATAQKANRAYVLLRSYLVGQYGKDANAVLNDFGMETPKPTGAKTVKVKADAASKAQATRKARHTLGKRQKQGITGAVPGVVASPIASSGTVTAPAPTPPAATSLPPKPAG